VDYDGSSALIGYRNQAVEGSYSFRQSEKNSYSFSISATKYKPSRSVASAITGLTIPIGFEFASVPAISNLTNSYQLNLSVSRAFSSTINGSLSIGLSKSENTLVRNATQFEKDVLLFPAIVDTVTESRLATYNASLSKRYELGSVSAFISNSHKPSSNGSLNESSQMGVSINHMLSSKLNMEAGIKGVSSKSESTTVSVGRKYYDLNMGLSWRLTRQWHLDADYRYRQQKNDTATASAESNKVAISLRYSWLKMAMSR
jgi:opacity protein-like surface antigen